MKAPPKSTTEIAEQKDSKSSRMKKTGYYTGETINSY